MTTLSDNVATQKTAVLAVDLGQQTGWAVLSAVQEITSGSCTFKPNRFEGGGMSMLRFRNWLDEMQSLVGPFEAVLFEEVRAHKGTTAAHIYGGFLGQLACWCEINKIPYQGVPVATIKKEVTGRGNAGKDEVITAIRALGFDPIDDNEADAIAILRWGVAQGFGKKGSI
jgi:Holliday junction resolvasome RuvABC endonuclease subunit